MPDIAKLAGLILDFINDYVFAVANAKIRPQSAAQMGADKIRAKHLGAIVLVVFLAVGIRSLGAGQQPFELLAFLLITLIYYSIVGALISFLFLKLSIVGSQDDATNDALTVVIGFNLITLTALLLLGFAASFLGIRLNYYPALNVLCFIAVLVAAGIALLRSELRKLGPAYISAIVGLLAITAWLYARYVVLMNFEQLS
jgi:hypothetical protein